jgi:hypothetical protein
LPKIIRTLGFDGPRPIAGGHSLFKLLIPPVVIRHSAGELRSIANLRTNMVRCADWCIR